MAEGDASPNGGGSPTTPAGGPRPPEPATAETLVRTFLIADVRGYTRFTHDHGDEEAARLAGAFAELAREVVRSCGGEVIELRGDEALCVFTSARQALRAAVELQTRFRRPDEDELVFPLPIGIGIDSGEAVPIEGGYRGGALNTAARLCSSATGGQILATDTTVSLARRVEGIRFLGRRALRLKGFDHPVGVVEVVPEAGLPPLPSTPMKTPTHRLARLAVGAVAAILVLAGLVALGVSRSTGRKFLDRVDPNAVGIIDAEASEISGQVMVGGGPGAIAAGGGFVWVVSEADGTVSRIDPQTHAVQTLTVGESAAGVAYGNGSVWVTNAEERAVVQVNTDPLRVVQTILVGNGPGAVAAGKEAVWVANTIDGTVSRIDLSRGAAPRTIAVGANPTAIAAGAPGMWVATEGGSTVLRLDPRSGAIVEAVNVGNDPAGIAIGERAVWVANRGDGTVSRIDPATSSVTTTIPVDGNPVAIAAGLGAVWVANGADGTVARIDPGSGRVEATIPLDSSPSALTVAAGSVWTSALPSPRSHRGGVLRLQARPLSPFCRCIDPLAFLPSSIATLLYDGLLTYRRVGGIAGNALVGNLAVRVPKPANGGTTYTFHLRPNIRFSNGAPLRASDVEWSIERMRGVCAGTSCGQGIEGLAEVEVDDAERTVTFRLREPDPHFLHTLAVPLLSVVPAGSTFAPAYDEPTPGTGPYRAAAFDPDRSLRLVRNRQFRVWAPDLRPDGYADEIRVHLSDNVDRSVAAVERGEADWVGLSLVARRTLPAERLNQLLTRHAGRLHSELGADTRWMFVNARVPPLNDLRVRRALSYATDRAEVAELLGGALAARPACQFLPPDFSGHRPHCPYTVNPNPAGTWTAPDLAKARALVAESGTRGMQIEIVSPRALQPEPRIGRYFLDLLRRLGYRPRLTILPDTGPLLPLDAYPADRAQIGYAGVIPLAAAPSQYFAIFSCSTALRRPFRHCDRAIDDQIRNAARIQASDPVKASSLWADIDRRVTDRALVIPLTNDRSLALVSERAGNYQSHSRLGALFEQMWVR